MCGYLHVSVLLRKELRALSHTHSLQDRSSQPMAFPRPLELSEGFLRAAMTLSLPLGCKHLPSSEGYQRTPAWQTGAALNLNRVIRKQTTPLIITGSLVFILHVSKQTTWQSFPWFPRFYKNLSSKQKLQFPRSSRRSSQKRFQREKSLLCHLSSMLSP